MRDGFVTATAGADPPWPPLLKGGKRKGEPLLKGGKLRAKFAAGNLRSIFCAFSAGPSDPLPQGEGATSRRFGSYWTFIAPRRSLNARTPCQLLAFSFSSFLAARALRRSALAALASGADVLLNRSLSRTALPDRSRR